MKITLIMVMSADGIIVKEREDVTEWTSLEDQKHLKTTLLNFDAVVTGRKSFFEKIVDKPYFVLSRKENSYQENGVTYLNGDVNDIINYLQNEGYEKIALLGGPQTNYEFLKNGMVSEIFLTVEPKMFGKGKHLNISEKLNCELVLRQVEKLNSRGTLLLHYNVVNVLEEDVDLGAPQPVPNLNNIELMEINKKFWDERAVLHEGSEYYDLKGIEKGKNSLVDYEIQELGDINGKKIIHLQCHIGTESISLAKLGADVTGVDYSASAIEIAKRLSEKCDSDCKFICANVYDVESILNGMKFDIVYVNFGAITLLPDLDKWAELIYNLLNDNGFLYLNELHPISSVLSVDQPLFVGDYFSKEPRMFDEKGSYADGVDERFSIETKNNKIIVWDRSLGEIITTIAEHGFRIEFVHEYAGYVDQRFHYQEKRENGLWYAKKGMPNTPATFSIKAIKSKVTES